MLAEPSVDCTVAGRGSAVRLSNKRHYSIRGRTLHAATVCVTSDTRRHTENPQTSSSSSSLHPNPLFSCTPGRHNSRQRGGFGIHLEPTLVLAVRPAGRRSVCPRSSSSYWLISSTFYRTSPIRRPVIIFAWLVVTSMHHGEGPSQSDVCSWSFYQLWRFTRRVCVHSHRVTLHVTYKELYGHDGWCDMRPLKIRGMNDVWDTMVITQTDDTTY